MKEQGQLHVGPDGRRVYFEKPFKETPSISVTILDFDENDLQVEVSEISNQYFEIKLDYSCGPSAVGKEVKWKAETDN